MDKDINMINKAQKVLAVKSANKYFKAVPSASKLEIYQSAFLEGMAAGADLLMKVSKKCDRSNLDELPKKVIESLGEIS